MVGEYRISDIYQGGYSSLDSEKGNFQGYRVAAGDIGMSTDARTANVLKEVSENIAAGGKVVEISQASSEVFEAIPNDQLKELNRLSKLTGVDMTVHAPVIEASGMTQQGWSEANREAAERQMNLAVERSHEVNPDGSSPVTFHSTAILPGPEAKMVKKDGKRIVEIQKMLVINRETGQVQGVEKDARYYPGQLDKKTGKPMEVPHSAEKQIETINESEWDQGLSQSIMYKESADRIITENYALIKGVLQKIEEKRLRGEKFYEEDLKPDQRDAFRHIQNAEEYLKNTRLNVSGFFNKAYKYGSPEQKEKLTKLSKKFGDELYIKNSQGKIIYEERDIKKKSDAIQDLMIGIQDITDRDPPKIHESLDKFAQDKTTTTFANIALNSYKKFKDKAPIISIENPPAGGGFARGEDLKNIVEISREKFVENATASKSKGGLGMSKSTAKKQAEKLLGVTWDVGHINMLRKQGFEKKDIIKETEKVAPFVKHVHLSDNFGFEHTELPMGMGNVPIKEIMGKLGEKGFKGKKIVEALSWWQHFSPGSKANPPFKVSLEAMGSPIYAMDMGPQWNQSIGLQQDYLSQQGATLPDVHFQTFGAGFSQVPMELGGQMPGAAGSRTSGRPME